jgi:hypothetical protein
VNANAMARARDVPISLLVGLLAMIKCSICPINVTRHAASPRHATPRHATPMPMPTPMPRPRPRPRPRLTQRQRQTKPKPRPRFWGHGCHQTL